MHGLDRMRPFQSDVLSAEQVALTQSLTDATSASPSDDINAMVLVLRSKLMLRLMLMRMRMRRSRCEGSDPDHGSSAPGEGRTGRFEQVRATARQTEHSRQIGAALKHQLPLDGGQTGTLPLLL
jgi:hypothetical protein